MDVLNLFKVNFEVAITSRDQIGANKALQLPKSLRSKILKLLFSLSKMNFLNGQHISTLSQEVILSGIGVFCPTPTDLLELISTTISSGNHMFITLVNEAISIYNSSDEEYQTYLSSIESPLKALVGGIIKNNSLKQQLFGKLLTYSSRKSIKSLENLFDTEILDSKTTARDQLIENEMGNEDINYVQICSL